MTPLIVPEIPGAQRAHGNQTFCPSFPQPHEQAKAGDTCHSSGERFADALFHESSNVAIGGIPLGCHRATLGLRNVISDVPKPSSLAVGKPSVAEFERAYESSVNDQVRVASDR